MISALLAPALKYIAGGLLALSLILGVMWKLEQRHAHKSDQRIVELTELRKTDRARYEAAQAQAEAQAKQNVIRVTAEQQRITSDVQSDYARQLADLRARFLRASKAHPGQPQGSGVSGSGPASPGIDGATGERLSPAERQLAAEISLRLRALQDWVKRQSGVNPN